MTDFTIVWSVVFALVIIRFVDDAVDYVNYRLQKKRRDAAFAEFLDTLAADKSVIKKKTVKKAVSKSK